jgi:hypothetical protein
MVTRAPASRSLVAKPTRGQREVLGAPGRRPGGHRARRLREGRAPPRRRHARGGAPTELLAKYVTDRAASPGAGQLVLAYRNDDVRQLNAAIRGARHARRRARPGCHRGRRRVRRRRPGGVPAQRPSGPGSRQRRTGRIRGEGQERHARRRPAGWPGTPSTAIAVAATRLLWSSYPRVVWTGRVVLGRPC